MTKNVDPVDAGRASYQRWRDGLRADPDYEALYAQDAARSDLWLKIFDESQAMCLTPEHLGKRLGLSRRQVAQLERRGYDVYSIDTLRCFVEAPKADPSPQGSLPETGRKTTPVLAGLEG